MFKNILVPVDGSHCAYQAVSVAANLARALGADLCVITVFDPVPAYVGEAAYQMATKAQREEAKKLLQEALKVAGELPGRLESEVQEGRPADVILQIAKTHGIDLIVMGSRGLGTLSGILLGSQSLKVLHHAECPVLVI
jgi:nucleotide-binding universal stress UspA family protein